MAFQAAQQHKPIDRGAPELVQRVDGQLVRLTVERGEDLPLGRSSWSRARKWIAGDHWLNRVPSIRIELGSVFGRPFAVLHTTRILRTIAPLS